MRGELPLSAVLIAGVGAWLLSFVLAALVAVPLAFMLLVAVNLLGLHEWLGLSQLSVGQAYALALVVGLVRARAGVRLGE